MAVFEFDGKICQNCRHWARFDIWHTGQCRRCPPGNGEGSSSTGVDWHGSEFPHTNPGGWCGEFEMVSDPEARLKNWNRSAAEKEKAREFMYGPSPIEAKRRKSERKAKQSAFADFIDKCRGLS